LTIGIRGSAFQVIRERRRRVRESAKPDFPKQLSGDQQRVLWVTRSPDTGFEGCYNSSGRGKEGPGESDCAVEDRVASGHIGGGHMDQDLSLEG
jgi:hypothetical protein